MCGLSDPGHSVSYISVKSFSVVVYIAKNDFTISEISDGVHFNVHFVPDEFIHLYS